MKYRLLPVFLLVFLIAGKGFAQESQPASWPIIERCLPAPSVPDNNWKFDGEILLLGWGGIHGVKASLDTPYVVYWGYGVISPDGQWVLDQKLHTYTEQLTGGISLGRFHFYYGDIAVTNLTTRQQVTFDWNAYISFSSSSHSFGPADPFWLDNRHFAAFWGTYGRETKIGYLDTGEIVDWPDISLEDYELSVSPDQTRMIFYSQLYELPDNTLITDESVATNYDSTITVWSSDSSMFIDKIPSEEMGTSKLTIFDRDGNVLATPFTGQVSRLYQWSPNQEYFSFSASAGDEQYKSQMFMLDMQARVVFKRCVDAANGWAWSPDGSEFATIIGEGQQPVIVTNLKDGKTHIAAYHTGRVLFWRTLE